MTEDLLKNNMVKDNAKIINTSAVVGNIKMTDNLKLKNWIINSNENDFEKIV